ncbi:hypothetical protein [Pseudomonas sp. F(2018)]|uniref:hypothetical protein n=1 Tax=Pseudomonas sp. F(2018) TaxID=2502240 RepID=UPI0010F43D07|nr:hypothetical protein [Pseudomonas sp. F(2018)]
MNKADMSSYDEQSYFRFVTFLFAGGFAFQFLFELITSPISEKSKDKWRALGRELLIASFSILLFVMVVNFEAHILFLYLAPSIIAFCVMVYKVIGRAEKAHKIIKEIHEIEGAQG